MGSGPQNVIHPADARVSDSNKCGQYHHKCRSIICYNPEIPSCYSPKSQPKQMRAWKGKSRMERYRKKEPVPQTLSQHLVLTSPCPYTLLASASARSLEKRQKGQPPPLGLGEGSRTVFLCHLPTLARYKGKAPSNFC